MDSKIRLQKHYVTNGADKARVFYIHGQIFASQNGADRTLRECVTLYAKDYSGALWKIFGDRYKNDTDIMTEYLDKGLVRIFTDDPLYPAALARSKAKAA